MTKTQRKEEIRNTGPWGFSQLEVQPTLSHIWAAQFVNPLLSLGNSHITSHSESQSHLPPRSWEMPDTGFLSSPERTHMTWHATWACAPAKDLEDTTLENLFQVGSSPFVLPIAQASFSSLPSYSVNYLMHFQFMPSLLLSAGISFCCL